jgi:hypothetical protein
MPDLLEGKPNLLPANGDVAIAFRNFWSRAMLLEYKPPDTKDYPIYLN